MCKSTVHRRSSCDTLRAMRITLKHQILMAPAAVLLLMTLLLGFLQYTYWDLSKKREQAQRMGTIIFALTQANMAAQRMFDLARQYERRSSVGLADDSEILELLDRLEEMHAHLTTSIQRIVPLLGPHLALEDARELRRTVEELSPRKGFDPSRFIGTMTRLQPLMEALTEATQDLRVVEQPVKSKDVDDLVRRATLVSVIVLGAAIPLGVLLALYFSRRILRRIQKLSDTAGRIVRGDLTPPKAPEVVHDELDDLALSINRMTEQLIRVVGTEKLLEGAEEERRRIAMDIHDHTLSDLSSILRGLQTFKEDPACHEDALALEEDMKGAIAGLRQLMDNLHPQTLDILGLGAALESHLERYLGKGDLPEYHLYISPAVDSSGLSRLAKLTLYRIAVEAIHNVIKHARASRYEVNLDRRGEQIVLSVEDNGVGIDEQQAVRQGGRGLHNIRERARAIGARVSWGPSRFSTGARFEMTLPLSEKNQEG
ncbi:MAG: HAMP domain-containing protein [Syntrophotaleaceae bacterium]